MKKALIFVLGCLFYITPAMPQTVASNTSTPSTPAIAKPYSDKEFEPWMLQLRRAEILAVGTFPLAYLFAGLGYDYFYYFSNGLPQKNVPWPLGRGTSSWVANSQSDLLQQKNLTLVSISLASGLILAGVDWFLGQ